LEASPAKATHMQQNLGKPFIWDDESEALGRVKPLDRS